MKSSGRIMRTVRRPSTNEKIIVDVHQGWKIFDGSKRDKTLIFFNCPRSMRRGQNTERMWLVETEQGGLLIEDESDIKFLSEITNYSVEMIKNIMKKTPEDTLETR